MFVVMCQEAVPVIAGFNESKSWADVREAILGGIDQAAAGATAPNPETWGMLPHQVAEQDRVLRRGGAVGADP